MADLTSSYKKASKKVKNKKVKPVFQSFIADMERIIELYDDGDTMFSSKEFDSVHDRHGESREETQRPVRLRMGHWKLTRQ